MTELTQKQKETIIDYNLSGTVNISIPEPDRGLYADIFLMFLANRERYSNFSAMTRDAYRCLLAHGIDWHITSNNNQGLDDILLAIKDLKNDIITGEVDVKQVVDKFIDDAEGFVK